MDDLSGKTIAIHQPNFLPWMGYFHKISLVDIFVFLDNVPFSKGSFTNRVKIHQGNSDQWMTVPLRKFSLGTNISEIYIDRSQDYKDSFLATIHQEYAKEELFDEVYSFLEKGFQASQDIEKLADYNMYWIRTLAEWMGIECEYVLASQLIENRTEEQVVLQIGKALKAERYISGMGGKKYLDEEAFAQNEIDLEYVDFAEVLRNKLPSGNMDLLFKSAFVWMMKGGIVGVKFL